MKQEYLDHIKEIEETQDLKVKKDQTVNFLTYLIEHGESNLDKKVLQEFCEKAVLLLPGRSEPKLCIDKYNLFFNKTKRVSFDIHSFEYFETKKRFYSNEGNRQATREDKKLSLVNTNPTKRFKPTENFEGLLENTTIAVSAFEGIKNVYKGPMSNDSKVLGTLKFTVEELILNPNLLKDLV